VVAPPPVAIARAPQVGFGVGFGKEGIMVIGTAAGRAGAGACRSLNSPQGRRLSMAIVNNLIPRLRRVSITFSSPLSDLIPPHAWLPIMPLVGEC